MKPTEWTMEFPQGANLRVGDVVPQSVVTKIERAPFNDRNNAPMKVHFRPLTFFEKAVVPNDLSSLQKPSPPSTPLIKTSTLRTKSKKRTKK